MKALTKHNLCRKVKIASEVVDDYMTWSDLKIMPLPYIRGAAYILANRFVEQEFVAKYFKTSRSNISYYKKLYLYGDEKLKKYIKIIEDRMFENSRRYMRKKLDPVLDAFSVENALISGNRTVYIVEEGEFTRLNIHIDDIVFSLIYSECKEIKILNKNFYIYEL